MKIKCEKISEETWSDGQSFVQEQEAKKTTKIFSSCATLNWNCIWQTGLWGCCRWWWCCCCWSLSIWQHGRDVLRRYSILRLRKRLATCWWLTERPVNSSGDITPVFFMSLSPSVCCRVMNGTKWEEQSHLQMRQLVSVLSICLMLHDFQNYAFQLYLAPDQSFKSQNSDKTLVLFHAVSNAMCTVPIKECLYSDFF